MGDSPHPAPLPPAPAGPSSPPRLSLPAASPAARRARWIVTGLLALIVLGVAAGGWLYDTLPRRIDRQQVLVFGQDRLAPGREDELRVVVRDAQGQGPVAGADVKVSLVPKAGGAALAVFRGRSGDDGSLTASLAVPADAPREQTLIVEARSSAGRDQVKQAVTVARSYKLLLTTDKPVYQPSQVIHLRALALSTIDMRAAAGADIAFLVEDPKGNKVFRQTVKSSEFGIAAADFTLADEVIQGDYKVTVSLGDTSSEKTVSVKPYVLPKFAVAISTERSYYLPGEHVAGSVQCDYFFGKPVAGGQVEIVGSVFDVQKTDLVTIRGTTDERGAYHFELDLPQYFAGGALEGGQAEFSLQVAVVDQAAHTEQASKVLPIAQDPIVIEAVPEAGVLKPGVENRLYILTSYPDGLPARTRLSLSLNGQAAELTTGDYGLAEYAFVPVREAAQLAVTARDERGQSAYALLTLEADQEFETVLLRPDRATYELGDTMHLVALCSQGYGSVFLDIVKDGQTLSTRSAPAQSGRAEFAVDLSGDLFGALTLHAYKVLGDGSVIRDTRLVVVDAPRDVSTEIRADHEVYRPGDTARLSFSTRTDAGPARSALGVAIVDESVFAVMEQDPGFAKLYFLLQKELLEPKYQVKGFTLPEVLTATEDMQLAAVQDQATRAAWAPLPATAMTIQVDSRPLKIEAAAKGRVTGLSRTANVTLIALILLPLGLWVTVVLGLRATGILGRALGRFGLALLVLLFGAPVACIGLSLPLGLLASVPGEVGLRVVAILLAVLLLGWLAAVVALALYGLLRRDERARVVWLELVAWVALGVVLTIMLANDAAPNSWLSALAVVAYLVGLGALLLFGLGLYIEGRRGVGVATVATVLLFVPALISAAALPQVAEQLSLVRTLGNPMVYSGPVGWLSGCAAAPTDLRQGLPLPLPGFMAKSAAGEAIPPQETPAPEQAAGQQEAPRVRQFFPETLLWMPELVTDEGGRATLDVPLADSITTWRVTALASTQDGQLGFSNAALRVFQDFFVDIDLPVALTQNDEVAIPVAVYNYLPEAQDVRLEVAPGEWFELLDPPSRTLNIAANDIEVAYFRIRVAAFGEQTFQVTAWGSRLSDAIKRGVSVVPDGRLFRQSDSNWLRPGNTVVTATVPGPAIAGTARIEVKIYPGAISQVVEDLERILKLPHG